MEPCIMCISDKLREIRPYIKGLNFCLIGTLTPLIKVRILVPQPNKIKGLGDDRLSPFLLLGHFLPLFYRF